MIPNPKLYAAVAAAFEEAITFISQDPKAAAEIYVNHEPQKRDLSWVENIIKDPKQITYSSTPRGIKEHADFMYKLGTLKHQAGSPGRICSGRTSTITTGVDEPVGRRPGLNRQTSPSPRRPTAPAGCRIRRCV